MQKLSVILLLSLMVLMGCQWGMSPTGDGQRPGGVMIERFDQVESQYLTLGDIASLHQMKTAYPQQTRTLIENVLQLGPVSDVNINSRFFDYFQDTTLQVIVADVALQYADMGDLEKELSHAFKRLKQQLPDVEIPQIYTQIGSLNQSIVVADTLLGISLDKYLGADYPIYLRYDYTEQQRRMMTREYIAPDCLGFYLLSLFPGPDGDDVTREQRRWHMGKIQCVVNDVLERPVFTNDEVQHLEQYRRNHPQLSTADFLLLASI